MTVSDFLAKLPIFNELAAAELQSLAKSVNQQIYKKGQTVVFKGTTVEGLHIVATGKVGVHAKPPKTHQTVQIAELGPGEIFGEMSIINKTIAGATVKASEDDTLIFILAEDAFADILSRDAKVQEKTQALIARRSAAADSALPQ